MPTNTYVAIQTVTLTSSQQYVEFLSIPQTYTDLQIICNGRDSGAGAVNTQFQVGNGSYSTSGSLYSWAWLGSDASTAATGRSFSQDAFLMGAIGTGAKSTIEINLLGYSDTNKKKTMTARCTTSGLASGQAVSMWVGAWRSTSAINQIRLYPGGQSWGTGSTFTLYGIKAAPVQTNTAKASGGTITYGNGYAYHTFTSTATFTPSETISADVLMIAGGGGGGSDRGAGGGAGGVLLARGVTFGANSNTITVGSGGPGGSAGGANPGTIGGNSYLSLPNSPQAIGGGYGTGGSGGGGGNGGSGGGAAGSQGSKALQGGLATAGQGFNGGNGYYTPDTNAAGSGGGGGAGAVGGLGTAGSSGAGGAGSITYLSWANVTSTGASGYFAGGGGGGSNTGGSSAGAGGTGGGGAGGSSAAGTNGTANTGGGGGGGSNVGGQRAGGNGGSGLVIIRYEI
jgi:hypothetical protein